MKGFSNIFRKKKKDDKQAAINSDDFITTDANSLQSMSNTELYDIIFRYDSELKNVYKAIEENKALNSTHSQIQEELALYK
jgi:hypothetical protein